MSLQHTAAPPAAPTCHPDRAHRAKGLCSSCYQRQRWHEKKGGVKPTKPYKRPKAEKPQVIGNPNNPAVAEFIANAAIKNQLDMPKTVREIAPDLSAVKAAEVAQQLEKNSFVQESIQRALEAEGLDDKSREVYVRKIWDWFLHGNKDQSLTAARLLGRAFIVEKVDANRPQELVIRNYAQGLEQMFAPVGDVELGEEIDAGD